MDHIKKNL